LPPGAVSQVGIGDRPVPYLGDWHMDDKAAIAARHRDALASRGAVDPAVPGRTANRMPTAASYLRGPGDSQFRAFKLDVMRIEEGLIAEVTTFSAELFPAFGLPPTL
jgi:RNA polymerase sigma-70 factor (ECF subfamily)